MATSNSINNGTSNLEQLDFFVEGVLAKATPQAETGKAWKTLAETSRSCILDFLNDSAPVGFFSKTSPVSCRVTEAGTLEPCSGNWQGSGMGSPTQHLTLKTSESRNAAAASFLSDILEATGDVPRRYYLTAKACSGILRRARSRGKELPPKLREALEMGAIQKLPGQ